MSSIFWSTKEWRTDDTLLLVVDCTTIHFYKASDMRINIHVKIWPDYNRTPTSDTAVCYSETSRKLPMKNVLRRRGNSRLTAKPRCSLACRNVVGKYMLHCILIVPDVPVCACLASINLTRCKTLNWSAFNAFQQRGIQRVNICDRLECGSECMQRFGTLQLRGEVTCGQQEELFVTWL